MISEIKVEYGYTKNMGNYETERLLVSATITGNQACDDQREAVYNDLKNFVHQKLNLVKDDSPPRRRKAI